MLDVRYFKRDNGEFVELTGLASTSVNFPRIHLSQRAREVARLIRDGSTIREVAQQLGIAERTVKVHLARVYEQFGIDYSDKHPQVTLCALLLLPLDSPFRIAIEARLAR